MATTTATNNWKDYINHVQAEYGYLAEGVSARGICPACDGGSTKEASLAISRDDGILKFKCHRASCNFRGRAATVGRQDVSKESERRDRLGGRERYAALRKSGVPEGVAHFLIEKYFLEGKHFAQGELRWTSEFSEEGEGRLVMPVRDMRGELYGFTARKLTKGGRGPKTLNFLENSRGSWYHGPGKQSLLLVEDQLSALRASSFVSSVAVLGTHISDFLLADLINSGYTTVYLALDKDARKQGLKTAIRLRSKLKMKVPDLPKDVKDMTDDELKEWLNKSGIIHAEQDDGGAGGC